jgi:hypothetical protein
MVSRWKLDDAWYTSRNHFHTNINNWKIATFIHERKTDWVNGWLPIDILTKRFGWPCWHLRRSDPPCEYGCWWSGECNDYVKNVYLMICNFHENRDHIATCQNSNSEVGLLLVLRELNKELVCMHGCGMDGSWRLLTTAWNSKVCTWRIEWKQYSDTKEGRIELILRCWAAD